MAEQTAWKIVDDADTTPQPKRRSKGTVIFIILTVFFSLTACSGVVAYLFIGNDITTLLGGGDVAETVTALVGPDIQVVVVKLRRPIVLERAVLVLQSGEQIETSTPTTEAVNTIAFFVTLDGGNSIPTKIMVRHQAGNFSYDYQQQQEPK